MFIEEPLMNRFINNNGLKLCGGIISIQEVFKGEIYPDMDIYNIGNKIMNSKDKGKRGEREFAELLRKNGIDARRGVQYSGNPESPDVVTELKDYHFEVKRTEKFNLYKAMRQAIKDAGEKIPIVAHRQNKENWVVILKAQDFIKLVHESNIVSSFTAGNSHSHTIKC